MPHSDFYQIKSNIVPNNERNIEPNIEPNIELNIEPNIETNSLAPLNLQRPYVLLCAIFFD